MLETILGGVGAAALAVGLVLAARALIFMNSGEKTVAEVVSCAKSQKGWYAPKVRYTASGKEVEAVSAVEFANEIKSGEQRLIIYNKKQPESFRFADSFRTNLVGYGLLALIGALFVARFWIF
ncbi:MAG: DUF3592 domain-containing protein [Ruminococcus sp.]|nr:DUF3592 domain-containing protein [Ruminococcus sp.]